MSELLNFNKFDNSFINKLDKVSQLCQELSLHLAVSKYKFIVNSPRGIFKIVNLDDSRKGKLGLGISKNQKNALEGVNLYSKKMKNSYYSREFANLHGYPKCCSDFGDYLCNEDNNPNNFGFKNPAVESLKRSKNFAWQLNIFTESLLSYYPCSLTCQESISQVNKIMAIFDRLKPKCSVRWRDILQKPASLYWTCADKILLYGDCRGDFKNSEIKYNRADSKIGSGEFYQANDPKFLSNLRGLYKKIKMGNRLVMTPGYFEIYKDKKRIGKIKKDNQYVPVLVKPNR